MHRHLSALLIAMAVGLLLVLPWVFSPSSPTRAASPAPTSPAGETFSLFWQEDFSAPILSTTYYITATPGSGIVNDGYFLLTQDATDQRGRIFYLTPTLMADFTATFQINLGDRDADGLAFLFCPSYDYAPNNTGGSLDASCPDGYIIAFDTYEPPSADQLYVAHDNTDNRIASTDLNLDSWTWYTAIVTLHAPYLSVSVGNTHLDNVRLPDYRPFTGYFGFSAATGAASSEHRVDEAALYAPSHPLKLWATPTSRRAGAGETVLYTVTLYNNTGITDDFALTLGEHQWPTALSHDHTGSLPTGTSLTFTVRVTIPQNTTLYEDTVTVHAESTDSSYTDALTLHTDSLCRVRLNDSTETYVSIQAAVDASTHPTDVVKVAGYCTGINDYGNLRQVVYLSKTLTIQGGYTYTQWTSPDPEANPTTVDARGEGRIFFITGTITPTLEGLRITGGRGTDLGGVYDSKDDGGGIYVHRANVAIRHCDIYSNVASETRWGNGGGIFVYEGSATISYNSIHDNVGSHSTEGGTGGGIYILDSQDIQITHNQMISNTAAWTGNGYGGGLKLGDSSNVLIAENLLESNRATLREDSWNKGWGGGMDIDSCSAVTVTSNSLRYNIAAAGEADGLGGGIHANDSTDLTIQHNTILSNVAATDSIGYGGGLYIEYNWSLTIQHNTILSNVASTDKYNAGYGGGIYADYNPGSIIQHNAILSNTASMKSEGYGGGIEMDCTASPVLVSNLIISNTASLSETALGLGGGLYLYANPTCSMQNNIIARNLAHTAGSAIYWEDHGETTTSHFLHTTIADNQGSAAISTSPKLSLFMTNTIIAGHTVGISVSNDSTVTLNSTLWHANDTETIISGTLTSTHAYHGDPAFAAPEKNDYHLKGASQAIDRGVEAGITEDMDGDPRPCGSAPDLGADEYRTFGVQLTPDRSDESDPGTILNHHHTITNTGNYTDTFLLTHTGERGWPASHPVTLTLAAGESRAFTLSLSIPVGSGGLQERTILTATSLANSAIFATVVDTTTAHHVAALQLTADQTTAATAGTSVTYTHILTNSGNGPDTFALSHSSVQGWTATYPPTIALGYGQSTTFVITITVPDDAISGTVETTILTATSLTRNTAQATITDTTTVRHSAALQLAPNHSATATPGSLITYTHILTNSGNGPDTFALSHSSARGWTATYPPTIALGYGQSTTFVITISIPADAVSGTVEITLLTIASQSDSGVQAIVIDRTTAVTSIHRIFLPLVLRNH